MLFLGFISTSLWIASAVGVYLLIKYGNIDLW